MKIVRLTECRRLAAQVLVVSSIAVVAANTASAASYVVIVVAGDAHAVGYGANAADLTPQQQAPQADVRFWYEEGAFAAIGNPALRLSSNGFVPLQPQTDPTGAVFGGHVSGGGPELGLGRHTADMLQTENAFDSLAIVKFAFNGARLGVEWHPDSTGLLVDQLEAVYNASAATLEADGHVINRLDFVLMLGEADAQSAAAAQEFGELLNRLICRMKSWSVSDQVGVTVGRLPAGMAHAPGVPYPYLAAIRAAQTGVADSIPCVATFVTDDLALNPDSTHLTAPSQWIAGERAVDANSACMLGFVDWFPCGMGDASGDGLIGVQDVVLAVNAAFRGADPPLCIYQPAPLTDADCTGSTDVVDVVRLVEVAFRGAQRALCEAADCYPCPDNCPHPCKR